MYDGLHLFYVQMFQCFLFVAKTEGKFVQPRLFLFNQLCQRDGCLYIGQRIVRGFMQQTVDPGQVFQFETRYAIVIQRPFDTFRPQCVAHAHHVDDVPA